MNLRSLQIGLVCLVLGVAGLAATTSQAGILTTSANAISAFQGTRNLSASFFSNDVNADIDFAAFAPGKFDDFLMEFSIPFSPSVPSASYVYAYQIEVLTPTAPKAGVFTVGLNFSEGVDGAAPSFIPLSSYGVGNGGNSDVEPTGVAALSIPATVFVGGSTPTSSLWQFKESPGGSSVNGTLDVGSFSAILFFSASAPPKWDSAEITAGLASGKSDFGDLSGTGVPVPAPEPGASVLLGIGMFILGVWRRKRRDGS